MNQSITNNSIEKPYDRFLFAGPHSLSDAELLAIIIRTGRQGADALAIAKELLSLSQPYGIAGLCHLSIDDLKSIRGIGTVKAVKLKCIAELSERIAKSTRLKKARLQSPNDFALFYMESLRHKDKEQCLCIFLDSSMQIINESIISVGCVNASLVSSREIFIEALANKAVYIVLMHNHPSGNATPSQSDLDTTNQIYHASLIMDIPLIDHIIIGDNTYYSFKENHLIN